MKSKVQTSVRQSTPSLGRWGRSTVSSSPIAIPGGERGGLGATGSGNAGTSPEYLGGMSPPHSPNSPPPIPPRPVIRQSSFTKIGYMINTAVNGTKKQFIGSSGGGSGEYQS
ncbi:uncharacterized protein LOC115259546 [Aedes albopictus]|uniref:Uncharacterized protein n=1 Tax=Aedes albopictus TaxID=7160 RepID=A0ABM1Z5L1_AEDAL|nr:uncharacterized protein LOC115259546 isoform X2 [Aedes albopictus]XP_029716092.1 uncharacterized protein LOC115259546 isoform X2 [Aedes albopictus]